MFQRLMAKRIWLTTIMAPPIDRHSHIGFAASIDEIKDSPATQDDPCSMPATEIEVT
jgi:hypothetical protein